MRVQASVKKMCRKCKVVRRKGVVRVICDDPRQNSAKDEQAVTGPFQIESTGS